MKKLIFLLLLLPLIANGQTALSDGALLMRQIKDMPYFYHYGVMYQGKVAHYSVDGFKYTTLEEFADGLPVTVVLKGKYGEDLKNFKKRYKIVVEQYKKTKYDAVNNNCESFANFLVFGVDKSFQSQYVVEKVQTYWGPIKTQILFKSPQSKSYIDLVDAYINNITKTKK